MKMNLSAFFGPKYCDRDNVTPLTLLLPRVPKMRIEEKSQISFCKILKYKWRHVKVLLKRFHLNGHIIGFHPQTQNLEAL